MNITVDGTVIEKVNKKHDECNEYFHLQYWIDFCETVFQIVAKIVEAVLLLKYLPALQISDGHN